MTAADVTLALGADTTTTTTAAAATTTTTKLMPMPPEGQQTANTNTQFACVSAHLPQSLALFGCGNTNTHAEEETKSKIKSLLPLPAMCTPPPSVHLLRTSHAAAVLLAEEVRLKLAL